MEIKMSGYEVFSHDPSDRVKARKAGYCERCHVTFWKSEYVVRQTKGFIHTDCLVAIADLTPRAFSPRWLALPGEHPDIKIMRKKARKKIAMAR
jgi:hypothetical protein